MPNDNFPSTGFLIVDAKACDSEDVIDSGLRVWYPTSKDFETKGNQLARLFVAMQGVTASLCGQKVELVDLSRIDEKGNKVPVRIGLSNIKGDSDFLIAVILPAHLPKAIFLTIVEEMVCLISMHTFSQSSAASASETGHFTGSRVGNYIVADSLMANVGKYLEHLSSQEGISVSTPKALKGETPRIDLPEKLQNTIKELCSLLQRASKHEDFVVLHEGCVVDLKMDPEINAAELKSMAWVLCHANGFIIDSKTSMEFQGPIALHTGYRKGGGGTTFARVFGAHHRKTAVVCFEHTGNAHPPMEDPKRFVSRMKSTAARLDSVMKKGVDESNNGLCENLQKLMCIAPTGDGMQNRKASMQSMTDTKDGFTLVPIEEPDTAAEKENSTILKRMRTPHSPPKRRSGKYQVSSKKVAKESDGVFEWSGLAELAASQQGEGVVLSHRSREALLDAQTLLKRATESAQSERRCLEACLTKTHLDTLGGLKSQPSLESIRLGPADPAPYCTHEELNAIRNFSEVEIHVSTKDGGHWIKGCKLRRDS